MNKLICALILAFVCGCYKYSEEVKDEILRSPDILESLKKHNLRIDRIWDGDGGCIIALKFTKDKESELENISK